MTDLIAGDVIELTHSDWHDAKMTGPVWKTPDGALKLGFYQIVFADGVTTTFFKTCSNKVISRAKRPFYRNSDKTEPTNGDVVEVNGELLYRLRNDWFDSGAYTLGHTAVVAGLHDLIVDGATRQAV